MIPWFLLQIPVTATHARTMGRAQTTATTTRVTVPRDGEAKTVTAVSTQQCWSRLGCTQLLSLQFPYIPVEAKASHHRLS